MIILAEHVIERLIQIEAGVHYCELPPPEHLPFVLIERESPIILSAPHGAITYRNDGDEIWHDEDEYTAGIALLLSEICKTSVIATVWRTADSDPNQSPKDQSAYKRALGEILATGNLRWVIDLHGAKEKNDRLADNQKIDLGTGKNKEYLPADTYKTLVQSFEMYLGPAATDRNGFKGFSAIESGRIAAFAHSFDDVWSVQLEMKPSIRVPLRRVDASMYGKKLDQGGGPYSASASQVLGMLQAIVDFTQYLDILTQP